MTTKDKQQEIEGIRVEQNESIKLTKNAKGIYQWEIKILETDIERLEKINSDLDKKFGEITDD